MEGRVGLVDLAKIWPKMYISINLKWKINKFIWMEKKRNWHWGEGREGMMDSFMNEIASGKIHLNDFHLAVSVGKF
jgi:hypothetical protein